MDQAPGLLAQGPHQPGMRMAQAVHGDPGQGIQVFVAVLVEQPDTLATHKSDRQAGIGLHQVIGHSMLISVLISVLSRC